MKREHIKMTYVFHVARLSIFQFILMFQYAIFIGYPTATLKSLNGPQINNRLGPQVVISHEWLFKNDLLAPITK